MHQQPLHQFSPRPPHAQPSPTTYQQFTPPRSERYQQALQRSNQSNISIFRRSTCSGPTVQVSPQGILTPALVDSGAAHCISSPNLASKFPQINNHGTTLKDFQGNIFLDHGIALVPFEINRQIFSMFIAFNKHNDLLLGKILPSLSHFSSAPKTTRYVSLK